MEKSQRAAAAAELMFRCFNQSINQSTNQMIKDVKDDCDRVGDAEYRSVLNSPEWCFNSLDCSVNMILIRAQSLI